MSIAVKGNALANLEDCYNSNKKKYNDFLKLEKNEKLRIREVGKKLNLSEAELMSFKIDSSTSFLKINNFSLFFNNLKNFSKIMFLTRNDEVVHEKTIKLGQVNVCDDFIYFYQDGHRLLIFDQSKIKYCFSEIKQTKKLNLFSFQFFNKYGDALLKIYIKDNNLDYFNFLVEKYKKQYEYQLQLISSQFLFNDQIIDDALFNKVMVNDFINCADYVRQYIKRKGLLREIFKLYADKQYELGIYVNGPSGMQFHFGRINKIVDYKGWLNILDSKFNLHVIESEVEENICIYLSRVSHNFHIHFYSSSDKCCLGLMSIENQDIQLLDQIKSICN